MDAHLKPARTTRRSRRRRWPVAATAATCALALVACGSSDKKLSSSGSYNTDVKVARCMRSHGVANFPSPFFGPGGHGVGIRLPAGFNPEAPPVVQAAKECASVGANIPGVP